MNAAILGTLLALSAALNPMFERANMAYNEEDFTTAIEIYNDIIAQGGDHPDVYYNLGNAYYRTGELGRAIANYERALELRPDFENARQNRNFALGDTKRALAKPLPPAWQQALLFWQDSFSESAIRGLLVLFNLLFWGLLALRQWRHVPYIRLAALFVFLLLGATATSAWAKAHPVSLAVAAVDTVPVRYGTGETESVRFELYEGDRVAVETFSGDWVRVRTVEGERGWARADQLAFVQPQLRAVTRGGAAL